MFVCCDLSSERAPALQLLGLQAQLRGVQDSRDHVQLLHEQTKAELKARDVADREREGVAKALFVTCLHLCLVTNAADRQQLLLKIEQLKHERSEMSESVRLNAERQSNSTGSKHGLAWL